MAKLKTKLLGVQTPRGEKMRKGKGWRLVSPGRRTFKAVLITRHNIGDESVAIFRVLPVPETDEERAERERWQRAAGKKAAATRKRAAAS